ncbi:MAG: MFS transporter [Planctomycetota bacterium]
MNLRVRTLVLIWLCALAAVSNLQRNLGVAESTVRDQLDLSLEQMGLLQSCFFWSYALFQVPTAWLGHRWGPRFGLTVFCLTWSLATGLTGMANSFWLLCAARVISGIGQAAALPCIAEVLSQWFSQSVRGRATALISASMQIGAALNAWTTASLLKTFSLTGYFWALAVPGFIWGVGFYLWFRNSPRDFTTLSPTELAELPAPHHQGPGGGDFSWLKLLSSPVLWLISAQQFCRAAGYIFFATWFATYLQETRHFDVQQSGIATGCTFAGVLLGALFGGTISDWILQRTGSARWARQGVAIASMVSCAACITASYALPGNDRLVAILSMSLMTLGTFFAGVGGPAGYTVTMDISGKSVAIVFGFMNMAGNFGAALFPLLVPLLLGPSKDQWGQVIFVVVGLYLGAAVFWSLINPHRTVFGEPTRDA